jgi:hypothetical protein
MLAYVQELVGRMKDGWTGSVVWPGTEFWSDGQQTLKQWTWSGQDTNLTSRDKRHAKHHNNNKEEDQQTQEKMGSQ